MELMLELQRQRQCLDSGLLHCEAWLLAIGSSNLPRSFSALCHPDAAPSF